MRVTHLFRTQLHFISVLLQKQWTLKQTHAGLSSVQQAPGQASLGHTNSISLALAFLGHRRLLFVDKEVRPDKKC